MKIYSRYRTAQLRSQRPREAQEKELLTLVNRARSTKFGRDHSFDSIRNVSTYQKLVPLRKYEDFWEQYWKTSYPLFSNLTWPGKIPYFALSSGTSSGTTKYIPISLEMMRSNTRAGLDILVHHVSNRPHTRIFGGKSFVLGGSTDLREEAPGILSGDLSGIVSKTLPWWAKGRYFPPAHLALLKNWEEKIDKLTEQVLLEDIRMLSGVPAWMLIFADKLAERLGNIKPNLVRAFRNLELVVHGGVNFEPYRNQFLDLLDGGHAELREVYPASEGFIALADQGYGEGLRLLLDNGIFFEFIPKDELSFKDPVRHWLGNAEKDVDYAIALTTCAGLWSYIIGDTVRFVDLNPPRILITGRTSYYLSAFGEHLIAEEIEKSMAKAGSIIKKNIKDYSVGALFPSGPGELGGHLYVVEFAEGVPSEETLAIFAAKVDRELRDLNEDYDAHRANGFGLNSPSILAVEEGTFVDWMRNRGEARRTKQSSPNNYRFFAFFRVKGILREAKSG